MRTRSRLRSSRVFTNQEQTHRTTRSSGAARHESSRTEHVNSAVGARHQDYRRHPEEQACADHAGDCEQIALEAGGLSDLLHAAIENVIAVVADERGAILFADPGPKSQSRD